MNQEIADWVKEFALKIRFLLSYYCLKYRQITSQGFAMKTPIFPALPRGLTSKELRKEIQRRMKIMDEMGLIKKPKNAVRG